jgi:pSer/pThr/pTyr-binding forkhead associated (FHA) protein
VTGDTAVLEDLASKNGSLHDGRRVEAAVPLRDGEQIRIGSIDLVFRVASVSASTATAP